MDICKNATEYERELWRRIKIFNQIITPKEKKIRAFYNNALEATQDDQKWIDLAKQEEKEIGDLYRAEIKIIRDFIESQPEKPFYVFRAGRKYYELKFDWVSGEYRKLKTPISGKRLLLYQRQKPGWIIEKSFPFSAFDIVTCLNCNREFTRYYPHEKYCNLCQRSPRSKRARILHPNTRYCQNPGCEKPIPAGKNKRTKYCCNACKTAAYEKRKL